MRDGILNHGTADSPATLEGQTVRLCDKISYIHHDMDDAERAGILCEEDIPNRLRSLLGESTRERLNTFVHDIVRTSTGRDEVCMSPEIADAMQELRSFLYRNLYTNAVAKSEEKKAQIMLSELYRYYVTHTADLPEDYRKLIDERGEPLERVVCDYISGMTDSYAIETLNTTKMQADACAHRRAESCCDPFMIEGMGDLRFATAATGGEQQTNLAGEI